MRIKIFLALLLASVFVSESTVLAEKTHIGNTYPSLGRGIRPLGMGNAFLTMKGDDENTIFYNPAAIRDYSNDTRFITNLPVPVVEINWSVIQLTKDLFDFAGDIDDAGSDSATIDTFQTFVDNHTGKFYSLEARTNLIGAYNRYFYVTVPYDSKLGVSFRQSFVPNFEIKSTGLAGVVVGSGYGFFEDTLTIGAAVKTLYGVENEQIITTSDILASSLDEFKWNGWKRGIGIGGDVGVKYEIYDFGQDWIDTLRPTVAVTYQNIGDTKFRLMKKNGAPDKLPQSVSAGIGFFPVFGDVHTALLVDVREINIKEDFLMKLNAGAEAKFPLIIGKPAIRGGLNQGYPTGGVGFEIGKLVWNMAFFGKEVGETTRQKGGYRLANEFTWRF
ncbi:MAG: hypothetical protein HYY43_06975 [Deltaproteobacteria bacterium]|nr:hypothetical protein [Deltaproteobacteria bacterium]MBI2975310.1 hypothetical protein [Deltaproteobacteria bacterium]